MCVPSAELWATRRRIEKMVKAQEGKHKDLVKFITHQTCISPVQIYKLVASLEIKKKILVNENFTEEPQPTILAEALSATDPVAMATQAIEGEWTAKQVREEVTKQKEVSTQKSLPKETQYDLIVADPPWEYDYSLSDSREIENQYPTMETSAIKRLPIKALCHADCTLFLWATSPKLEEALSVLNAWGVTYKTCAVWDKQKIGMGYYFRQQHELILVGTKREPSLPAPADRPSSVFQSPRQTHSEKPDMFYDLIETMYPRAKKLELFARKQREGFHVWGNEVLAL